MFPPHFQAVKLLVLAQTPPPVHGQSVMVHTLVRGLPAHGVELRHVNLRLSRDQADIGRWRWGKLAVVLDACLHAIADRFAHGCDTLYYVPAPAKRGALYRDWMVMLLCRPFFRRLVLHWHAAGLGEWLRARASAPERALTRLLLGRADLAIVLGEGLREDAAALAPRRIAVVPNGIADPCPGFARAVPAAGRAPTALFLGLGIPEKGMLDAIAGAEAAGWRIVVAGDIPDPARAAALHRQAAASGGRLVLAGFIRGEEKHRRLAEADALVFPTYYPAETQGLVVAEALAHDLPVVVTRWRAVAENLPPAHVKVVPPRDPAAVAAALRAIARAEPPAGASRRHFLAHLTLERHLAGLAGAIGGLDRPAPDRGSS